MAKFISPQFLFLRRGIALTLALQCISYADGAGLTVFNVAFQRAVVPLVSSIASSLILIASDAPMNGPSGNFAAVQPSDKDNQVVQMAFRDFDNKRFDASEKEFTTALARWNELHRPRDEVVSLLKARANVRLDNKQFDKAVQDYNQCIELMKNDGEDSEGRGRYPEYPDTFVGRGLAKEGLADWQGALGDYDKAVTLWGGSAVSPSASSPTTSTKRTYAAEEGINPYVLTFRGNALARLNKFDLAAADYESASNIFNAMRDVARYSDARANLALTLYQLGDGQRGAGSGEKGKFTEEAVRAMKDVVRKNPGYADMHVALAADAWSTGDYIGAVKEWRFACDRIDVGCEAYKDPTWVSTIRRWPTALSSRLTQFLNKEMPANMRGSSPAGERMGLK